jgi:hypothetical protein
MRVPRHHLPSAVLAVAGAGFAIAAVAVARPSAEPPAAPAAAARPAALRAEAPLLVPRRHARRGRPVAPPARIRIPSIGVDARVVRLGLDAAGALEVPSASGDAGWYVHGPRPGQPGPAVMAGHVDSTSGPAVFYRLGTLRPRATIRVSRADGTTATFRVHRVERWPKAGFPTRLVYGPTRRPTLRLITCGGAFDRGTGHYVDNTIVFAVAA